MRWSRVAASCPPWPRRGGQCHLPGMTRMPCVGLPSLWLFHHPILGRMRTRPGARNMEDIRPVFLESLRWLRRGQADTVSEGCSSQCWPCGHGSGLRGSRRPEVGGIWQPHGRQGLSRGCGAAAETTKQEVIREVERQVRKWRQEGRVSREGGEGEMDIGYLGCSAYRKRKQRFL